MILTQRPVAVEMSAQMGQITNTAWKNTCGPRCQHNFNSGILASGKTRIAPKPSKSNAACWSASNSTNMPLARKCQINNRGYLQLRSFTFFALYTSSLLRTILNPASWWLARNLKNACTAAIGLKWIGLLDLPDGVTSPHFVV